MREFTFGRFKFDPTTGLLFADGEPTVLGRRGAALLGLLLARRGEVLTKAELMDAAWPDTAVEESNLSVQIATLRQAIGRSPDGREWIATLSRIGYRFIADDASLDTAMAVRSALPLLVLRPFSDPGNAAATSGLAAAFVDDLLIGLSRFKSLNVVADHPAAPAFRAGTAAGARYGLGGSISRMSGGLRVTAHLTDLAGGILVWGGRFDGDPGDGPAIEDEIIARVVAMIELQIQRAEIARSQRERPLSTEAYDLYLMGQFYLGTSHPDDNAIALRLFNEALRLEPDNVLYLAGAAEALQHRIAMGWAAYGPDDRRACRDIGYRGLSRASEADAGSLSLFGMSLFNAGEPDLGFATIQRAVTLNPNSLMASLTAGLVSVHWGDLEEAEAQLRRAYRLNPLDPLQRFVLGGLARIRLVEGRFEAALGLSTRAMGVNANLGQTHWARIAASASLGRLDEAAYRLERYKERHPGVTIADIRAGQPYRDNRAAPILEGLERAGLPVA